VKNKSNNNLNTERFIAKRIISADDNNNRFSKPIVTISVLAISLGIAVMILTTSVITGFKEQIQYKLAGLMAHIQITNYDANTSDEPSPINKNQPFLDALETDSDIKHIQAYTNKSGILKTDTENEGIVLRGVDESYDWAFINKHLIAGRVVNTKDSINKDIVISKHFADKLLLKLNDKVIIHFITKKSDGTSEQYIPRAKAFYISGIYETGLENVDKHMAIVDLRHIQKLNYWNNNQIAGFEVMLNDYKKADMVNEKINDAIGLELISETLTERNGAIFSWLELQDINAIIIILLMLLVAGINMISALLILILERTNMIGILKALGAKNKSIRKIFLYNAAYLIGRGLIWGNLTGLTIALLQYYFGIIKLDQATYYVSVIPIKINLIQILLLNIGTMVCCITMLLLPSIVISKISPVKAIRYS
jgi:lipoprotein-releasing system permease protein